MKTEIGAGAVYRVCSGVFETSSCLDMCFCAALIMDVKVFMIVETGIDI
jgi:hypothetical protein